MREGHDMQEVWLVMTEVNGYRNFFGSFIYTSKGEAENMAQTLRDRQQWDEVYIVPFWLN